MVSARATFECNHQLPRLELNFVLADFVAVVLFRKLVHLDDHLFSASVVDHCPPEGSIADVPVVDAVVPLFATFLCKLMCRCGILCILELFHTCDHVVCLFECRSTVWRMSREWMRCTFDSRLSPSPSGRPHTQYMTPGLQ